MAKKFYEDSSPYLRYHIADGSKGQGDGRLFGRFTITCATGDRIC